MSSTCITHFLFTATARASMTAATTAAISTQGSPTRCCRYPSSNPNCPRRRNGTSCRGGCRPATRRSARASISCRRRSRGCRRCQSPPDGSLEWASAGFCLASRQPQPVLHNTMHTERRVAWAADILHVCPGGKLVPRVARMTAPPTVSLADRAGGADMGRDVSVGRADGRVAGGV